VYMRNVREFSSLSGRVLVVAALVLAAIAPALVSVVASAAQVTERSIALSSTSRSAKGVSYQVNFKAAGAAEAFVVDFCLNSPLIGQTCTESTGFSASAAATSTPGYTLGTSTANKVIVNSSIGAGDDVSVTLTGINNPTAAGPLYARIVTFEQTSGATAYTSTVPGTTVDQGGLAISITDTVGVSGTVLESMTFCVSGAAITENCAATTSPVLALGQPVGQTGTVALVPGTISTGDIYTQISTNAANGAVISLKSSALNCGGLLRSGDPTACDIAPALKTGITTTDAKFGVLTSTSTDTGTNATGTLQPYDGSGYNDTTYTLNYAALNATGVTSTFGDQFLDTDSKPANNKNMKLTFGVSVTNNTPAGLYSADLSMIATGKF
jgi:hypothetical protein